MPLNPQRYRVLSDAGITHEAALLLADTDKDNVSCAAVPNAAAAPTQAEFNALLTSLRGGGVILP